MSDTPREHPDPPLNPLELFDAWYDQAREEEGIRYPHAMCLSTVDAEGRPDARMVLLLFRDEAGFVFFTDDRSAKARQLQASKEDEAPHAALTFYWESLDLQIRIRGSVLPTSDAISDHCFAERPRGSRITAWAAHQSQPLASRQDLLARHADQEDRHREQAEIPRPPHWRAYRLQPNSLEFWQAQRHRLHKRWLYELDSPGPWRLTRLEP